MTGPLDPLIGAEATGAAVGAYEQKKADIYAGLVRVFEVAVGLVLIAVAASVILKDTTGINPAAAAGKIGGKAAVAAAA